MILLSLTENAGALFERYKETAFPVAFAYIQKVTDSPKAVFFVVTREALILQDLKRPAAAKKVTQSALELSRKADNKDFIRMNLKIINQ